MKRWTLETMLTLVSLIALVACGGGPAPSETTPVAKDPTPVVGRWDVTVEHQDGAYPSWFEIEADATGALSGRFVGRFGSARPIAQVHFDGQELHLSLPPQYEEREDDLMFMGHAIGDRLEGETKDAKGQTASFVAVRAPALASAAEPAWGEPIDLLANGLEGWRVRTTDAPNRWTFEDGALINAPVEGEDPAGVDLITERTFGDFKLSLEFQLVEESNSGVYLRGRYEVQVLDDQEAELKSTNCGGVYGFLTPTKAACRPAGEWNQEEITLVGRRITVVLNGETVIDDQEIPGITGGALDSDEGAPGPLMLQGDHDAVRYRNINLTPAAAEADTAGAEG